MSQVHDNATHTVEITDTCILITGKASGKTVTLLMGNLDFDRPIPPPQVKALKATGKAPADHAAIHLAGQMTSHGPSAGCLLAVVPVTILPVIMQAEAAHRASRDAAIAAHNSPAGIERRRIDALYGKAEDRADYPAESLGLQTEADRALAAWRLAYPEAARAEDKTRLLRQAEMVRGQARDAMTYGSADDRQRHHDKLMAMAADLEAQAAAL